MNSHFMNYVINTKRGHSSVEVLCNAVGGGGISFRGKKCYESVRFDVISVTRGWGSNSQEKNVT